MATMHARQVAARQRIDEIKKAYQPGMSSSQLAAKLGTSRGAIIGIYNRNPAELAKHPLRVPTKRHIVRGKRNVPPGRTEKQKMTAERARSIRQFSAPITPKLKAAPSLSFKERMAIPPVAPANALHLTLMELEKHSCRFPTNTFDKRDDANVYTFCGLPTVDNSSYCHLHTQMTYKVRTPS